MQMRSAQAAGLDEEGLIRQLHAWLGVCRSTQPLDREEAAAAIRAIYGAVGMRCPAVLFFSSPFLCQMAWWALAHLPGRHPDRPLARQLHAQLWKDLWPALRSEIVSRIDPPHLEDTQARLAVLARTLGLGDVLRRQLGHDASLLARGTGQGWALREALWGQLEQLREQPLAARIAQARIPLERTSRSARPMAAWEPLRNLYLGAWSCGYEVMLDFEGPGGTGCLGEQGPAMQLWLRQGKACHAWFPYEGVALVSERPRVLTVDEQGRLHGEHGAALVYRDGYAVHAWHGVPVEPRIILAPQTITLAEIDDGALDPAVRSVLLTRYGPARYLQESGATLIHADERGKLWRRSRPHDSPLVMVEVPDPAPAPGAAQSCFLRVPPEITRASEAVAWTFGLEPDSDRPLL